MLRVWRRLTARFASDVLGSGRERGAGSSTMTWSCTFDAEAGAADDLAATFRRVYDGGMEKLEALLVKA